MAINTMQAQLLSYYDNYYVPAMGFALMMTQQPDAALRTVQEVLTRLTRKPEMPSDLRWLFSHLIVVAPNMNIQEGYNPTNAIFRNGRIPYYGAQNIVQLYDAHTVPTQLSMITGPIQDKLERGSKMDRTQREKLTAMLRWLSSDLGEVHLAAYMDYWLQKSGEGYGGITAEASVQAISETLNQSVDYAVDLISRGHALWQQISGEMDTTPTMEEAIAAWIGVFPFPSASKQVAQIIHTTQKFSNRSESDGSMQVIVALILAVIVMGWLNPGLAILPWQWRSFVQIPLSLEQKVGEFNYDSTIIYQPWKVEYTYRDARNRALNIIHEKSVSDAWSTPLEAEDELVAYVDILEQRYPVYREYESHKLYMRFVDGTNTVLMTGAVGEEDMHILAKNVMGLLIH